ncbi:CBS domain-containing protein [Paraburkholderia domus]|uniref:CBS domain-containing protein n=1 Tax=Paraburkholderia domus TaxID=2793075 RepID=UPI001914BF75|nr:CBS domain-containing protein [Paraburkholderia domus]MBK5183481.1 CBS domain-containing protein [Burkholderia sp. R-69749]CAE6860923.1 hypothetical protein R69749_05441 [Paraburkholderia domus]
MRAIDVMTPAVVVAAPELTVRAAAKLLADNHISGMPVVDTGGQVIGMISEGDLSRMVGDEISRLSAGARVHDYIQVIAIKRVSDKVRLSASRDRANGNHQARAV